MTLKKKKIIKEISRLTNSYRVMERQNLRKNTVATNATNIE